MGYPFPSPGDLLNPGIKLVSLASPALARQVLYPERHLGSRDHIFTLSLKDGSFSFSGTGHDWTPTGLSFRPESTDVANEVPSCPGLSAFCLWLWWLITQDVVVGGVRLVGGVIQPLPRHHFPFLYKNNTVPPRVMTAHQISLTVFLRSSAYFYSFGYFILGLRRACFGPSETYCFISGCPALMWTLQLRSGRGEDVVLGFRFAARPFAQSCSRPHSPGQAEAPGQVSSKSGLNPARDGQPGPDDTGSSHWRRY